MSQTTTKPEGRIASEGNTTTFKDPYEVEAFLPQADGIKAPELLSWATAKYHPRIALASSFSAEDIVIIDLIDKLDRKPRIFAIDTGRLNQETYDVIDKVKNHYDLEIDFYFPESKDVEAMLAAHGPNLFYSSLENRKLCCSIRKVEPLKRALSSLDAWITGLRREQAVSRKDLHKVEIDGVNGGIIKINPLADWSADDVWQYVRTKNLPYNALYDQGYTSIGCAPCTRPTRPGLGIRSGRWWWEDPDSKECGLHHR